MSVIVTIIPKDSLVIINPKIHCEDFSSDDTTLELWNKDKTLNSSYHIPNLVGFEVEYKKE